jgi:hypothetical protein
VAQHPATERPRDDEVGLLAAAVVPDFQGAVDVVGAVDRRPARARGANRIEVEREGASCGNPRPSRAGSTTVGLNMSDWPLLFLLLLVPLATFPRCSSFAPSSSASIPALNNALGLPAGKVPSASSGTSPTNNISSASFAPTDDFPPGSTRKKNSRSFAQRSPGSTTSPPTWVRRCWRTSTTPGKTSLQARPDNQASRSRTATP